MNEAFLGQPNRNYYVFHRMDNGAIERALSADVFVRTFFGNYVGDLG